MVCLGCGKDTTRLGKNDKRLANIQIHDEGQESEQTKQHPQDKLPSFYRRQAYSKGWKEKAIR
jgi:hypothetical protein